jgi:hypothetical protein
LKNECSSARSTSTPPLFSSCVGEGRTRVSTASKKGKKEEERTTNRIALGHQPLPLPYQPLHLILRRLPHRLENLILLRRGVRHIPSKVLVNALVKLVDRLAEVFCAHVGSGTAEGGTRVGVVEGDFGRWGGAEELFEAGEEVLHERRERVSAEQRRGGRRRTYEDSSERTAEDETDVGGEVLVVLLASLSDERCKGGNLLPRREGSDDVVHVLCMYRNSSISSSRERKEGKERGRTDENNMIIQLILILTSLSSMSLPIHLRHLLQALKHGRDDPLVLNVDHVADGETVAMAELILDAGDKEL